MILKLAAAPISHRITSDGWGKGTVNSLASYIQEQNPGIWGFSAQNLWRMRQFFETYRDYPELSTMLRELHPDVEKVFRDAYVVKFLELPEGHLEAGPA